VFGKAEFETALGVDRTREVLQRPDVSLVVVELRKDTWRAIASDVLVDWLLEQTAKTILERIADAVHSVTMDFGSRQVKWPATHRMLEALTFVPSGIQTAGRYGPSGAQTAGKQGEQDPPPPPPEDVPYICDGPEHHVVERQAHSTGTTCGEPCADGAPCAGILKAY
jgi:hypothetical protein